MLKGPSKCLRFKKVDSNYKVTLLDIGMVVEHLIGNGYVSEYSKRGFKAKYQKYLLKRVSSLGLDSKRS